MLKLRALLQPDDKRPCHWYVLRPSLDDPNYQIIPTPDKELHDSEGTECWCEPTIEKEHGIRERIVVHKKSEDLCQ